MCVFQTKGGGETGGVQPGTIPFFLNQIKKYIHIQVYLFRF